MSKHTPGPWKCIKYPKVFSINTNGRQIAIMTEHHGDCPLVPMHQFERSEQDVADAALISAAPEMLEALKLALRLIENMEGKIQKLDYITVTGELERAIAKAEGK